MTDEMSLCITDNGVMVAHFEENKIGADIAVITAPK